MDTPKYGKKRTPKTTVICKHFSYLQRPLLPPVFLSVAAYSRMIRSPTPSGPLEDTILERSSINSFINMFSGIETPITTATNETISDDDTASPSVEGYPLERFVGEIDDFFKCPLCKKIVKKPKECIYCQNLMCKSCITHVFKCPYGCLSLQVNQLSKFALMSYMGLKIKCCYSRYGCEYIGRIKDIKDHEKECEYSEVKCINPVCEAVFLKKNKSDGPIICSEICSVVLSFKNVLETGTENLLSEFIRIVDDAKASINNELKSDLQELMNEAQSKKEEVEEFLKAKELLYVDIEEWRTMHHSGKWNQVVKWWSCCENREKYSKGCSLIN
jgi:hypothetical protein